MMLRYCADLKAIRYESTSLNRIAADKSHRVTVALNELYLEPKISKCSPSWIFPVFSYVLVTSSEKNLIIFISVFSKKIQLSLSQLSAMF